MSWSTQHIDFFQTLYWRTEWKCRRGQIPFWVLFRIHDTLVSFGLEQFLPGQIRDLPTTYTPPSVAPAASPGEINSYVARRTAGMGRKELPSVAAAHRSLLSDPTWSLGCADIFPQDEKEFLLRYGPLLEQIAAGSLSPISPEEQELESICDLSQPSDDPILGMAVPFRAWRRLVVRRKYEAGILFDPPVRLAPRTLWPRPVK